MPGGSTCLQRRLKFIARHGACCQRGNALGDEINLLLNDELLLRVFVFQRRGYLALEKLADPTAQFPNLVIIFNTAKFGVAFTIDCALLLKLDSKPPNEMSNIGFPSRQQHTS